MKTLFTYLVLFAIGTVLKSSAETGQARVRRLIYESSQVGSVQRTDGVVSSGSLGLSIYQEGGVVIMAVFTPNKSDPTAVETGDELLSVNDQQLVGMSIFDAAELATYKVGKEYRLRVKKMSSNQIVTVSFRVKTESKLNFSMLAQKMKRANQELELTTPTVTIPAAQEVAPAGLAAHL